VLWVRYGFDFVNIIWSNFSFEDQNYIFLSASSKKNIRFIQNISFLPFRFVPKMESKIFSTMLSSACPTVIPSFHVKVALRLPFEDSLVSCLFLCLQVKIYLADSLHRF
jgi:hypothetical protein